MCVICSILFMAGMSNTLVGTKECHFKKYSLFATSFIQQN